jgi:hypothetical protein
MPIKMPYFRLYFFSSCSFLSYNSRLPLYLLLPLPLFVVFLYGRHECLQFVNIDITPYNSVDMIWKNYSINCTCKEWIQDRLLLQGIAEILLFVSAYELVRA